MKKIFDIIVLGLGAHGSSAVYHLSKNTKNICGIDRFTPPHTFGSSHGQSRIIRQAYHESPMYVPLVKEAYTLWNELEQLAGVQLLLKTGGLMLGEKNASIVEGAKLSAETHGIPYRYLDSQQIKEQYPAFKPTDNTVAVFEENAGILFPEKCIKANLEQALMNGATVMYNETVTSIKQQTNSIELTTNKAIYETQKLVVSAGAWLNELLPELELPLKIKRQVLFWFKNTDPEKQSFLIPENMPVYIWEYKKGKVFYGFPDLGDGIKVAPHHEGEPINPNLLSQETSSNEVAKMRTITDKHIKLKSRFNYADVCMYTNTPDEDFIIDYYPGNENIVVASPCSGHGFKFSSVIGKMLCDMVLEQPLNFEIKPFSINRFATS